VLNDSTYYLKNKATVKFETLKFYISAIQLLNNTKSVWLEKNSYHLCTTDSITNTLKIKLPTNIKFNALKFNVGIDSLTNVSGAMGGDLDPTKGMYWTWQSGYINFKLEGQSSLSSHSKKEFQLHLGGYAPPLSALQTITLAVKNKSKIDIVFDVEQFVNSIDLSKQHHIMSPNTQAVILSQLVAKCFKEE